MSLDELKAKIKNDHPISSIIGNYLIIKKSGTSSVALCPFHSDSNPSLQINDSKKMFRCFACDTSGDVIEFVMRYRNLNFVDALKEISEKNGIDFKEYKTEAKLDPSISIAYEILSAVCSIYYHQSYLYGKPLSFEHFAKDRGLTSEIIDGYRIGMSPDYNVICEWLENISDRDKKEKLISIAVTIGLVRSTSEGLQDVFKSRIMFPIINEINQVIGFTSRSLDNEHRPRHMNSIDSFIYDKRKVLFGMNLAKNAIKEKDSVILVEDSMDQIALYSHGFQNSVALMGFNMGAGYIEKLLTVTRNIYVAFDNDPAGFAAMVRIDIQLNKKNVIIKFVDIYPSKDPDHFIRTYGAQKFQERLDNAITLFDYFLNKLTPEKIPEVVDRKLDLLKRSFEILEPLGTSLEATERLINFAKTIGLKSSPEQIVNAYQNYLNEIEP